MGCDFVPGVSTSWPSLLSVVSVGPQQMACAGQIGRKGPNTTEIKAGSGKGLTKSTCSQRAEGASSENRSLKPQGKNAMRKNLVPQLPS